MVTKIGYGHAPANGVWLQLELPHAYSWRLESRKSKTQTYSTAPAQRASFTLTDGSRVTLAPASKIQVTGRIVELNGEAVFTVTQNTGAPFVVRALGTETRVLGTTFGVRAYDNVRVAVAEGRVSVSSAILTAGDIATIHNGAAEVTHNMDVASMLAWTTGRLEFRNTPTADALGQLSRWYGVEMKASTHFKDWQITGALDNATQQTAVEFMSTLLNARVERNGNNITFLEP
jgi:transmembrane sensor